MNIKKVMLSKRSSQTDLPFDSVQNRFKKGEKLSYDVRNQISGCLGNLPRDPRKLFEADDHVLYFHSGGGYTRIDMYICETL